jgi:heat shock protein 4
VEEEEYEETVKEKRELPAEEAKPEEAEAKPEAEAAAADGKQEEKKDEKKDEKKYEWIDVVKKKKRTKRTDLKITVTGKPGFPETLIQKYMDQETAIQADSRELQEKDEKRNDLESYIFNMRDKISSGAEYGEFVSGGDRDKFNEALTKAEDWLYDNMEGTKAQFIEKLDELKATGDAIAWRFKEDGMRAEWVQAVIGTIKNYRAAAENPGEKYGHIAAEKLGKIVAQCNEMDRWLADMRSKQEKMPKYERPVLICADMEKKNQELAKMADEILAEKPPPPPKEAPKEKEEEEKKEGEAKAPEQADGPQNMDVD